MFHSNFKTFMCQSYLRINWLPTAHNWPLNLLDLFSYKNVAEPGWNSMGHCPAVCKSMILLQRHNCSLSLHFKNWTIIVKLNYYDKIIVFYLHAQKLALYQDSIYNSSIIKQLPTSNTAIRKHLSTSAKYALKHKNLTKMIII